MSGHSKWATTKRAKAVTDAKRASQFTRLSHAVTLAAREKGGDPSINFSLRLAIEKARSGNMPKENIERAVKRGTGELEGYHVEEIFYEGYGPGGVACIVKVLTDNKNRSVSEIKHIFIKHGGSLGGAHSVLWMFKKRGSIGIQGTLPQDMELKLIELGVCDSEQSDDGILLITLPEHLQCIKEELEKNGIIPEYVELEYHPNTTITVNPETRAMLQKLFAALEDLDDVVDYYTNLL